MYIFLPFRTAPVAHGASQARNRSGIGYSCQPTSQAQQLSILNPLCEARDRTCVLTDTSRVHNPLSHNGNSL